MKKNLTRIASLLLVLSMLFLLGGCGTGDKAKLLGTWEATMDMSDYMNEMMAAEMGEETGDYFTFDGFALKLELTFREDDTYAMVVDEASVTAAFENLKISMKDGLTRYFEDMLKESGMEMTVDEMMASMGMTMDSFLDELFDSAMAEITFEDLASEGNYKVKDGKIYMSDGKDTAVDEAVYDTYTLEDGKLTLTASVDPDMDEEEAGMVAAIYPLVFTKTAN